MERPRPVANHGGAPRREFPAGTPGVFREGGSRRGSDQDLDPLAHHAPNNNNQQDRAIQPPAISVGQCSHRGRKPTNQDFYGAYIPQEPQLSGKGIAVALADGISTSEVSHIASEMAVRAFLEDYYCTSDAWSVKKSVSHVLMATNSWLHAQTRQNPRCFDNDRGYVCTLSGMVIKSTTAYIFHVGDARIYRLQDQSLEQLTADHRLWIARDTSYLSRALGVNPQLEIDYHALELEVGDRFLFATDGVYEWVDPSFMVNTIDHHGDDLDAAAQAIVKEAGARGSGDNLTVQIIRIDRLPECDAHEFQQQATRLPFPPELDARAVLDGYEIIRPVHTSARSHVYLAVDSKTETPVALKIPASDVRQDPAALERFLMEEWIARRIDSPYVVKPRAQARKQNYVYVVTEFIQGQTLSQWMLDNPRPTLAQVRTLIEQIGKGLCAFHRQEMLHQDLRPANVLIDSTGSAKIIDFGSVSVAGIAESKSPAQQNNLPGTAQYMAPEYLLGHGGTAQADIFSLGVIAYQMLTGRLPYGAQVAKSRTWASQKRLRYASALNDNRNVPVWIDGALRKATHPNPSRRYEDVAEFLFDLQHPRREFLNQVRPPLIERNPVRFWQGVSLILAIAIVVILSLPAIRGE